MFCRRLLSCVYNQLPAALDTSKLGLATSKASGKRSGSGTTSTTPNTITIAKDSDFTMPPPLELLHLASTIGPVLRYVGEHIANDLVLFPKVCRVLRHILLACPNIVADVDEKTWINAIITRVLLPGLAMVSPGEL